MLSIPVAGWKSMGLKKTNRNMDKSIVVLRRVGQSKAKPQLQWRIWILEIQSGHYVGFVFGIDETGLASPADPITGKTKEESLDKCIKWANAVIPDLVFAA